MESNISHSEIISNFANSIKDKSNFDSVKIQGDFYYYDKYKKKNKYDVGNLMMASHDLSNGNLTSSVKRLEYIINEQPEYHSTYFYIQVLIKLNLEFKIEEAVKNAIKHHPEDSLFLNLFGKNLLFSGDKFKALKFLEKSVEKSPHNCSFWLDLAFCYFTLRNLQMAELCLSTAQKINFDHKRCYMLSALLFQEKSLYKETLEIYKKAMELYPNDNEIMVDLAVFYLRIGKKREGYRII